MQIVNLRKIFRVKSPDWIFRGVPLWEELAKLEMRMFKNELTALQLKCIKNAIDYTNELPDENLEHHELALALIKGMPKYTEN